MREILNLDSSEGEGDGEETISETGSPTTKLNANDMKTFGALPMEDDIVVVRCKSCQRPILASSFNEHSAICSKDRKRGDEDYADNARLAGFFSDDEDISQGENSKKGKTSEKQTNHSSDPLDPTAAPAKRPPSLSEKPEKKKTKKEKQKQKATPKQKATAATAGTASAKTLKGSIKKLQSQAASPAPSTGPVQQDDYIDSDEEVESVMQAIRQSCPAPLAEKPFYFVKRRRQCFRLRDILLDAITPKTMTGSNPGNSMSNAPPSSSSTTSSSAHYHTDTHHHHQVQHNLALQHPSMAPRSSPSNNSMIGFSDGSHMFSSNVASPSSVNTTYSIR
ncbi:hypothetical protein DFQ30_000925 [Apophysomyces sp. BC1015]|nr:hypothetical protein DFQ29_000535 [Apophysomyces sp. BC1021]KAG0171480.1 hypothetical protein DFQ30_000925 [Apophysomyces sp. BC1015]